MPPPSVLPRAGHPRAPPGDATRSQGRSPSSLALAAALATVGLLACDVPLQGGLAERDANELVAALAASGIAAQKRPEGGKKPAWAVGVPSGDATAATQLLAELRLPRRRPLTTQDVLAEASLVESPSAERLKHFEALEGDLEQSLETMDGIVSAAVELVVPAPQRGGTPLAPSKASVLLRTLPGAADRLRARRGDLQALVAASVEGLNPTEVVLVVDAIDRPSLRPAAPSMKREGAPHARWLLVGLAALAAGAAATVLLRRRGVAPHARGVVPKAAAERPLGDGAPDGGGGPVQTRAALPEGSTRRATEHEAAPAARSAAAEGARRPTTLGPVISPSVLAGRG